MVDTVIIEEARRQVGICNACRYCEGFCAAFPDLQRNRHHSLADLVQLSNLCHNCRACHYSCQYTEPHEFRINLPRALADVRVESWRDFIRPRRLSTLFQHHGVAIALLLVVCLSLMMPLIGQLKPASGVGFYAYLSHAAMVTLFTPAFLAPLALILMALRRYWTTVGGQRITLKQLRGALKEAADMRNLDGGQGQGCNFEKGDRYSQARRHLHHATMYGFLLCFASTSTGTLMHYLLDMQAPYAWYSLPKLLGVPGGLLLVVGCAGLAFLKCKADLELGAQNVWGAEMAFVILLGATGLTGLILYALTGTTLVQSALIIHLATVMTLFLLLPFSKMVHGFFRVAALIRNEQTRVAS